MAAHWKRLMALSSRHTAGAADGLLIETDTDVPHQRRAVRLRGELDLATAPQLLSSLDTQGVDCDQLEVDLSGLAFCDLIGLTALEHAQQRLGERGCQMTVHGIHGQFRRLLDVPGLRSPLSTSPSPPLGNMSFAKPRRALASFVAGLVRQH